MTSVLPNPIFNLSSSRAASSSATGRISFSLDLNMRCGMVFCSNSAIAYPTSSSLQQECCRCFKGSLQLGINKAPIDCDNFLENGAQNVTLSDCNMACAGNLKETCGAGNRLNVFTSGKAPPPPPTIPAKIGNWTSLGCHR